MNRGGATLALLAMAPCLSSCQYASHHGDIEVISIKREVDTTVPGHEMCKSFTLTKQNVETYFSAAKEVDGQEFHHEALILPCQYTGTIRLHDNKLQWRIYASGAGYLHDKDSVNKRYLCKEKCCDRLPGLC